MKLTEATQERLRRVVRRITGEVAPAYEQDVETLEGMTEDELRAMVIQHIETLGWFRREARRTE